MYQTISASQSADVKLFIFSSGNGDILGCTQLVKRCIISSVVLKDAFKCLINERGCCHSDGGSEEDNLQVLQTASMELKGALCRIFNQKRNAFTDCFF